MLHQSTIVCTRTMVAPRARDILHQGGFPTIINSDNRYHRSINQCLILQSTAHDFSMKNGFYSSLTVYTFRLLLGSPVQVDRWQPGRWVHRGRWRGDAVVAGRGKASREADKPVGPGGVLALARLAPAGGGTTPGAGWWWWEVAGWVVNSTVEVGARGQGGGGGGGAWRRGGSGGSGGGGGCLHSSIQLWDGGSPGKPDAHTLGQGGALPVLRCRWEVGVWLLASLTWCRWGGGGRWREEGWSHWCSGRCGSCSHWCSGRWSRR